MFTALHLPASIATALSVMKNGAASSIRLFVTLKAPHFAPSA